MAYFKQNEQDEYTSVFQKTMEVPSDEKQTEIYDDYDDGFDMLTEGPEDEVLHEEDPEEAAERRKERFKFINGISDFVAVIIGTVVILLLVAFLISLINWLSTDIRQTFTLWQTKL